MGAWPLAFLSVDTQLAPMLSPELVRVQAAELNKDLTSGGRRELGQTEDCLRPFSMPG